MFAVRMISWLFINVRELCFYESLFVYGIFPKENIWRPNPLVLTWQTIRRALRMYFQVHLKSERSGARASTRSEHFASTPFFSLSIVTQNLSQPFTRAGVWSLSHSKIDLASLRNIEEDFILRASNLFFVHELFWGLDQLGAPSFITHSLLQWSSNFSRVPEWWIGGWLQGRVADTCLAF